MPREKKSREPGHVSDALRRRMGDALTDLFDDFGPELYRSLVESTKDNLVSQFQETTSNLEGTVKDELGRRGLEEASRHFGNWISQIVEDIVHHGMNEATEALDELAESLTSKFLESEEGDELLEVEVPDDLDIDSIEELEEVSEEDVEPEPEGGLGGELFDEIPEGAEPAAPGPPEGELESVPVAPKASVLARWRKARLDRTR